MLQPLNKLWLREYGRSAICLSLCYWRGCFLIDMALYAFVLLLLKPILSRTHISLSVIVVFLCNLNKGREEIIKNCPFCQNLAIASVVEQFIDLMLGRFMSLCHYCWSPLSIIVVFPSKLNKRHEQGIKHCHFFQIFLIASVEQLFVVIAKIEVQIRAWGVNMMCSYCRRHSNAMCIPVTYLNIYHTHDLSSGYIVPHPYFYYIPHIWYV